MFKLVLALVVALVSGQAPTFPESWGAPPMIQTMDYRALPGGYGHGSSTLATWILLQMDKEREKTGHGARALLKRHPQFSLPRCPPHSGRTAAAPKSPARLRSRLC